MTERSRRPINLSPDGMPSATRGEISKRFGMPSRSRLIWGELKYIARLEKERFKKGSLETLAQAGKFFLETIVRTEPKKSR